MLRRIIAGVLVCLTMGALAGMAYAQANVATATLRGAVSDPSKALVVGATVTARSVDRGVSRQATTNGTGEYQIPLLNPGVYEVTVTATGFATNIAKNVTLTVGQIAIHDIQLGLGDVEQSYVVATEPPLIEPERSQQANTIEKKQIENLPNLTRDFREYIYTLPGVVNTDIVRLQYSRSSQQRNSGFSIGGGTGQLNYVTVDGGENEVGTGGLRIRNLSVEAIQEFQVNRNAFAAEFGFTTGTAINVVSRSGTNQWHGSAYAFFRSQHFSARSPFDFGPTRATDQQLTPGFTLSGPIAKSKAFFFTSYEAFKQDEPRFRTYASANDALYGPTAEQQAYFNTLTTGPLATDQTRRIAGFLQAALAPSGFAETRALLRSNEGTFILPSRAHNWSTRVDYEHSATDSFNGRFTFSDGNRSNMSYNNLDALSNMIREKDRDYSAVGTWNHIFGEGLYNQLRVQYVKNLYEQLPRTVDTPSITIQGVINLGQPFYAAPTTYKQNRYQFDDTLAWARGGHNFKFGVSYRPVTFDHLLPVGFQGVFQFTGGLPLATTLPAADRAALTGGLAPPAATVLTSIQSYNLGLPLAWVQVFGNPRLEGIQNSLGFFEQDSWKATPRLTLNYGLRVDYEGVPKPLSSRIYVAPRFGFAWDALGDGKTILRGGGGMFYAPTTIQVYDIAGVFNAQEDHYIAMARTIEDGAQSSVAAWRLGRALGKLPLTSLSQADAERLGLIIAPGQQGRRVGRTIDNFQNPYTIQASLGVSRLLAKNTTLEVAYQFYRGVHLPLGAEGNYRETGRAIQVPGSDQGYLFGPELARIDPTVSALIQIASWGTSTYHGMTSSLSQRMSRLVQFTANYTYSKSIDDGASYPAVASASFPTRRFLERGVSDFDVRHNFVFQGVFDSPFQRGAGRPWYERAFADVSLSPIVTMRSGFPFTVFIGADVNRDTALGDRPFYAPRNSGRGANFISTNLRLNKRLYLGGNAGEGLRVELIAEASNLFNRTNFLRVNDAVCGDARTMGAVNGCELRFLTGPFNFRGQEDLPATSPLGFTGAAPGRQLQLGLKIAF
jgi:hypothetical protein